MKVLSSNVLTLFHPSLLHTQPLPSLPPLSSYSIPTPSLPRHNDISTRAPGTCEHLRLMSPQHRHSAGWKVGGRRGGHCRGVTINLHWLAWREGGEEGGGQGGRKGREEGGEEGGEEKEWMMSGGYAGKDLGMKNMQNWMFFLDLRSRS